MSNCNKCNQDPCGCNRCEPARYSCGFDIQADPFDNSTWVINNCGALHRVKIPKMNETCTNLSADFSTANLIYNGECGQNVISGKQLGALINLNDLRDVDAPTPDSCDFLVFDPGCTDCGNGCKPKPAMWRPYHIPDAGDCEIEVDSNGYYHVLVKDDCGCIRECRLPVIPDGSTIVNYTRDSVPDDPDYPWYYGCYNDTIHLYLAQNAPQWFNKYDLEVTIYYGIQSIKSDLCPNVNFRSLLVPVVDGDAINTSMMSSILQGSSLVNAGTPEMPWGSMAMRGSFTFIVPKGKEAYLHHEYRLRNNASFPNYAINSTYDGKKVPDSEVTTVNTLRWPASRLNALQAVIKPARGVKNLSPTVDPERSQLDDPVDSYVS